MLGRANRGGKDEARVAPSQGTWPKQMTLQAILALHRGEQRQAALPAPAQQPPGSKRPSLWKGQRRWALSCQETANCAARSSGTQSQQEAGDA